MNGKWKGLALLAATTLLAAGCSTQGNAQSPKTVVINEDVQFESSLADSSLELSRQEDVQIGDRFTFGMFHGQQLYYNKDGELYSFDIQYEEDTKIASVEIRELSEDGSHGLSYEQDELLIHNLKTGESKTMEGGSPEQLYFANPAGTEVFQFEMKPDAQIVNLIQIDTGETTTWDLSSIEDYSISYIKKMGDKIVIPARPTKGMYGIYQLTDQGTIEMIEGFNEKAANINDFHFLENGTILFEGNYDEQDGIFLLNRETDQVQLLVAGGEDSEGKWIPSYNLSPDEKKIMFGTPVQVDGEFKANVYMGELVDGKLTNSVRILEHVDINAVISYSGSWSEDSKTAYVATNENGGSVAVFAVK
ncbi:hypothetical protein OXB_3490 [Bacillus sp. OxB-1]|uniref:hypothetical protein n=1 Tax=Bacillus sp. (strain OxB-1) TaxID=98228 RepID=UPI000581BA79|nr:hypothetical protein [Bacillus sp. OxB-1]BAQ11959.1 hypothetical protein OXB_3490 [Bacillus sp. OxB-1]